MRTGMRIDRAELEKMAAHAVEGHPYEVVGLLAGSRSEAHVTRVVALRNERADSPKNRYVVSGLVLMRAEEKLLEEGLEIVGYYHSHPDHPAQYSTFDRDHALPNMDYLILSVSGPALGADPPRVVDLRVWRLLEDRSAMTEIPLEEV